MDVYVPSQTVETIETLPTKANDMRCNWQFFM